MSVEPKLELEIFQKALFARRFEERIAQLALAGEIPATLHPGAGQEVCQIAALAALRPDDPMLYGHRGTAYWIARDLEPEKILCDITCREGGTTRGRGGSMHVVDPARGILGESGTLGGNFTLGAGVAFAEQYQRTGRVAIVFFGEGTSNRGQFHEAANFAALQRLPLILFCENNGWGLSVPVSASTAVENIADRAAGYAMPGTVVDGCDAAAVFAAVALAAERARRGDGPSLIEAKVLRLGPHWLGDRDRYRSDADREALRARDPLPRLEQRVASLGLLDSDGLAALEASIAARIERALDFMRAQPLAAVESARQGLWAS